MSKSTSNSNYYDVIARFLAGEASDMDKTFLDQWLKESDDNRHLFEQLRTVWLDTGKIAQQKQSSLEIDIQAAWQQIEQRTHFIEPQRSTEKAQSFWKSPWLRVAAIVLVIVGSIGLFQIMTQTDVPSSKEVVASNEYITAQGPEEITLEDESLVNLNTQSQLRYPKKFNANTRSVELVGQAFFDIQKNPNKPFIINTNGGSVEVLGTSFMVSAFPEDTQVVVTVKTGKVKLSNQKDSIYLTKGMTGRIDKTTGSVELSEPTPEESFWKDKTLRFNNTPLKEVVRVLNKVYKSKIRIDNPALETCPLTVQFEDESLDNILLIIESTFNLNIHKRGNKILLNGKAC